jgi:hypothetical protein
MTPARPTAPPVTLINFGVQDLQRALTLYQKMAGKRIQDQMIKSYFFRSGVSCWVCLT